MIVPFERIKKRVLVVRDQRVMLSTDLAELYGVETRVLVQAVRETCGGFRTTSCSS